MVIWKLHQKRELACDLPALSSFHDIRQLFARCTEVAQISPSSEASSAAAHAGLPASFQSAADSSTPEAEEGRKVPAPRRKSPVFTVRAQFRYVLQAQFLNHSLYKGYEPCDNRMVGVGRDLCGSSSPTPLPKQGHLEQAAQDLVQVGLEYLQRRRTILRESPESCSRR